MTLAQYLKTVEKHLVSGRATEHTHRTALETLIESLADRITATNEPKRIECGAPDFIVTRAQTPVGYIEAKDIGKSLDVEERSEQMHRYYGLGNVVLTDYLEFRWYLFGEKRLTARCARVRNDGKLTPDKKGEVEVRALLIRFLNQPVETIASAKDLAKRMAHIAQLIRDITGRALAAEHKTGSLHDQMKAFRDVLLHDLGEDQFADMYAQTICYGLFAARCNARGGKPFTREHAAYDLPKTNPFLRQMFNHIAGPDLDDRIAWAVDDLAELLRHARISDILQDFGKRTRREDPVVHFYETFLAAYDPKLRETRGVYYTPEPVVSYIARSVDHILKTDFKLKAGLADASKITLRKRGSDEKIESHKVLILDPATGTGTFLYGVINLIFDSFKRNRGMWSAYVSEHLLPRLFGFELLMAPYAVAHLKLGLQLDQLGYDFNTTERLHIYLTNTIEKAHDVVSKLPFVQWIADEANAASRIKQDLPIMVIVGNPPYSRASYNRGEWIEDLMGDYKTTVRGEESQIQGLSNDYIKFIRFAQWRIDRTDRGVFGLITGHGYLNGPQARDMRASLLKSFDKIYVLNLHGSVRRVASGPRSERDEPVFSIQQGTAIILAIKDGSANQQLFYSELLGSLETKFTYLSGNDISSTRWIEVTPEPPNFFFVPRTTEARDEYDALSSLVEIFGTGQPAEDKEIRWATGFASQQDDLAISFDDGEIDEKISRLLSSQNQEELRTHYRLCTTNQWSYERAKTELSSGAWKADIVSCAYRPFDLRRTVFNRNVVSILRATVMRQLLRTNNQALVSSRVVNDLAFAHAFVAKHPVDKIFLSSKTSTNAFVFPLYVYFEHERGLQFSSENKSHQDRLVNLAPKFLTEFAENLEMVFNLDARGKLVTSFGPEDVFDYIYAVLYSPTYRSRYAEFLKIDFPRLPLTSNPDLFRSLCAHGAELIALHLMTNYAPEIVSFPVGGDNRVETIRYTPGEHGAKQGRVWINREQYFEGVPPEVWNFHLGGYQVCQKWLKDRKNRELSYDDMQHYKRTVAALAETMRLMSEIDRTINEHSGWPIQ